MGLWYTTIFSITGFLQFRSQALNRPVPSVLYSFSVLFIWSCGQHGSIFWFTSHTWRVAQIHSEGKSRSSCMKTFSTIFGLLWNFLLVPWPHSYGSVYFKSMSRFVCSQIPIVLGAQKFLHLQVSANETTNVKYAEFFKGWDAWPFSLQKVGDWGDHYAVCRTTAYLSPPSSPKQDQRRIIV